MSTLEDIQASQNPGIGTEHGVCECCQREKYLTRHHIVPYAFSRHFPNKTFQDNRIMVCRDCHDLIEIDLRKFRRFFRGRLGITSDDLRQSDAHIQYKKAKAYAWQLVSNHAKIPTQTIMEMTLYVIGLYPDAHSYEDFKRIARDEAKIHETRTDPYGKVVASKIMTLGMEEWFWGVWVKKNKSVIKKLRAKGVDEEKLRKRRRRYIAAEASKDDTIKFLMRSESKTELIAGEIYASQDKDGQQSLRRCAYNWIRKSLKESGKTDEATKDDTIKYMETRLNVSEETAGEIYRLSSKRKKKSLRKQAFEYNVMRG